MKQHVLFPVLLIGCLSLPHAAVSQIESAAPSGAWARLEIENGDSLFIMSLRPVRITSRRKFKDLQEQRQYHLYKRAARKVYPLALQALDIYSDIQTTTTGLKNRERRRYIRKEHKELKEDFEGQMKNLTRTEGKVLIKMLEKELNAPFYDVIRDTRGGMTATYWHNLGKVWGYNLKDGYRVGKDTLLDEILIDYDFGHPDWWNQQ